MSWIITYSHLETHTGSSSKAPLWEPQQHHYTQQSLMVFIPKSDLCPNQIPRNEIWFGHNEIWCIYSHTIHSHYLIMTNWFWLLVSQSDFWQQNLILSFIIRFHSTKNDNLRDSGEIKLKKRYLHFMVRITIVIMFLCTATVVDTVRGGGTELARPPTSGT